ncbi:MAG: dipeptidase [Chitinophagaceae bacterium]|nr:dipeptidase [Chitinophagaceae bacterium]
MSRCILALLFCLPFSFLSAQSYKKIHKQAIVTDSHNDIISTCVENGYLFDSDLSGKTHSDLKRMKKGGLDVQVFSIFCGGNQKDPYNFANREIDSLYAWVARNPNDMMIVTNGKELDEAIRTNKLASMMGVEGGHMIEDDLSKLDALFKRGVRYMTLTWNNNNSWATSAEYESGNQKVNGKVDTTSQKKGLSEFGKQVVRRMNELGMMVDLSHVGEQTFWDAINTSTKPILVSHSNAYTLCPVFRNLKDDQIKAVANNGGVIDLNFYAAFLDSTAERKLADLNKRRAAEREALKATGMSNDEIRTKMRDSYQKELDAIRAPFELLFDHMEYIIKLAGIDHVGLGGDFDGISVTPQELTDVTKYPLITKELVRRGYSKEDIFKIMGGNFIRVFKANLNE